MRLSLHTVSARIAMALAAVVVLAGGLVMMALQDEQARAALMSAEGVMTVVGLTALAAWLAVQPLARRAARLAAQVDTLTEQLARQAQQLAKAERQRTELLAKLSHDLRTPAASMQGYLELLLLRHGSLEPAEARNYLQTAARQSERLSRLVNDLFERARLDAEDMQIEAEPFVLAELVNDAVQQFAAEAERRQLGVALVCEAGSCQALQVRADLGLVERLLGKLLDNALRHTPAGGQVVVEITRQGAQARVRVRDSGCGMAAAELPGVFDRYEDASRVGDASGGRPGLGLAIARRIASLHGSELRLRSQPGQGTEVDFELPLAR